MKIKDGFNLKKIGERAFIFSPKEENMFVMNSTSIDIWNLLIIGKTEREIVEELSSLYDVSEEILVEDVHELLLQMKSAGVIID